MATTLWDTTGGDIIQALLAERRTAGALASGLALTLVVVVDEKQVRQAEDAATIAAAAHPCRVLIVVRHSIDADIRLDAEVQVGGRLGATEAVVMRMYGRLALHAESVVLPLLAPDAPVVTWWHGAPPKEIATDALGVLANRRITDCALAADPMASLKLRAEEFIPGVSIVDVGARKEVGHVRMFNPEPASVTAGRQYLYNATLTSALGDQACASCHIGGDFDGLAWDLGNPGNIPLPITTLAANETAIHTIPEADIAALIGPTQAGYIFGYYQPCKGPMTTQSLRGLDNAGPMHWRGDRNGAVQQTGVPFLDGSGNPVVSAQPSSGIFDEFNAFMSFNVAFPGLVGNAAELSNADMTDFTNFILQSTYPPNPIRALDNSLTPSQAGGAAFFVNAAPNGQELPVDRFHNCNGCHVLDRNGNAGVSPHPGFFGTDGRLSFENEPQTFKVPHLRNAYQKVGMFASALDSVHAVGSVIPPLNPPLAGVRGFGFQHDGADGKLEDFFTAFVFIQTTVTVTFDGIPNIPPNPYGIPLFANPADPTNPANGISTEGLQLRHELADYAFAFDTNLFPIVGQQVTLTPGDPSTVAARIALLEAQASAGQTDLVAHGTYLGQQHGFTFSAGKWTPDLSWLPPLTDAQLQSLAFFGPLTFMAVPPGEGWRVGVDRDGDGYADGDELALGTDPANPSSYP